jgi:hypothetical protein
LGHALVEGGHIEEGLRYLRRALTTAEALPAQILLVRVFRSQAHAWIGEAVERQGKLREALQEYSKSKEILNAIRAAGTNDLRMQVYFTAAADRVAAVQVKLGSLPEARKEYDQSLELLEPLSLANPDNMEVLYALAETYTGEGDVAVKLAQNSSNRSRQVAGLITARDWFEKSKNTWSKVAHPARISTSLMEVTLPNEVARRLGACNAKLTSLNAPTPASLGSRIRQRFQYSFATVVQYNGVRGQSPGREPLVRKPRGAVRGKSEPSRGAPFQTARPI